MNKRIIKNVLTVNLYQALAHAVCATRHALAVSNTSNSEAWESVQDGVSEAMTEYKFWPYVHYDRHRIPYDPQKIASRSVVVHDMTDTIQNETLKLLGTKGGL